MKTFVFIFIVACLFFMGVIYGDGALDCYGKTADIGFPHRYKLIGGCQIETRPGIWMPLDNYRVVP
jgi:hypothetical protein